MLQLCTQFRSLTLRFILEHTNIHPQATSHGAPSRQLSGHHGYMVRHRASGTVVIAWIERAYRKGPLPRRPPVEIRVMLNEQGTPNNQGIAYGPQDTSPPQTSLVRPATQHELPRRRVIKIPRSSLAHFF